MSLLVWLVFLLLALAWLAEVRSTPGRHKWTVEDLNRAMRHYGLPHIHVYEVKSVPLPPLVWEPINLPFPRQVIIKGEF